jgi:hypothetical protein
MDKIKERQMTKKMLVLALGVLLVAAFCVPTVVKAETKLDFSGYYRVRYFYKNNYNLASDSDDETKSSYFDHRFRINPILTVSDCLRFRARVQSQSRWGNTGNNTPDSYPYGPYGDGTNAMALNLNRAWMEIKTKYGAFSIGRQYGGSAGLERMGYVGPMFDDASHNLAGEVEPFESSGDRDKIEYALPLGAFTLTAYYEKNNELDDKNDAKVDTNGDGVGDLIYGYDDDADTYGIRGDYKWATGSANMAFIYHRFRDHFLNQNAAAIAATEAGRDEIDIYHFNPAYMQTFGPFSIHAEFDYMAGVVRYDDANGRTNLQDKDLIGWGGYVDAFYNYGSGEIGAQFQYLQGADDWYDTDDTKEGVLGYGGDHYPWLLAQAIIANHDLSDGSVDGIAGGGADRNYWAFGLQANHNLSEILMLHAAIGYFQLVNVPDNYLTARDEVDKNLGFEADFGLHWKIMEGLDLSSVAGYFWAGSAFEYGGLVEDPGNAYSWANELRMSF